MSVFIGGSANTNDPKKSAPASPLTGSTEVERRLMDALERRTNIKLEITKTGERLRELKQLEDAVESEVLNLQTEKTYRERVTLDQQRKFLETQISQADMTLKKMQYALERAVENKTNIQRQLLQIQQMNGSTPAGVNLDVTKRELNATRFESKTLPQTPIHARSGNGDTLNQSPEKYVSSVDSLGMHDTASPLVKSSDYKVNGPRPQYQSDKFSDWRNVNNRTRVRVSQPPGGKDSGIFG